MLALPVRWMDHLLVITGSASPGSRCTQSRLPLGHCGHPQSNRLEAGALGVRREVLHGRVWLEQSVQVVSDSGGELAVLLEPGSRLSFPPHPFGPHPWAPAGVWSGPRVLQLYRPGDWYSVWRFYRDGAPAGWYINFEAPIQRQADGFATLDYGIDIAIDIDGQWQWKDAEHPAAYAAAGRMTGAELIAVRAAAADMARCLDSGDRWWSRWNDWTPPTI